MNPPERVRKAQAEWGRAEQTFMDALREANDNGMSWRELAKVTGIPCPTLHRWVRAHGIEVDQ
jgi:hypothetical protein